MGSWTLWISISMLTFYATHAETAVEVNVVGGIPRSDLVCWTCPNHMDNESCNRWAPNLACPQNHTVCQTVHMFSMNKMESLSVEKRCVKPTACTEDHVRCELSDDGATKLCVSCCNGQLCNEEVPTDISSAINLSSVFEVTSSTDNHSTSHILTLSAVIAAIWQTGFS